MRQLHIWENRPAEIDSSERNSYTDDELVFCCEYFDFKKWEYNSGRIEILLSVLKRILKKAIENGDVSFGKEGAININWGSRYLFDRKLLFHGFDKKIELDIVESGKAYVVKNYEGIVSCMDSGNPLMCGLIKA